MKVPCVASTTRISGVVGDVVRSPSNSSLCSAESEMESRSIVIMKEKTK